MLPSDFPKWRTVYEYYRQWSLPVGEQGSSFLEKILKKISWSGPYQPWEERKN
jgi:hypothetical protein